MSKRTNALQCGQSTESEPMASGRVTATKQPRIILTAMQNHQRRALGDDAERIGSGSTTGGLFNEVTSAGVTYRNRCNRKSLVEAALWRVNYTVNPVTSENSDTIRTRRKQRMRPSAEGKLMGLGLRACSGTGLGAASLGLPGPTFRRDVVTITHPSRSLAPASELRAPRAPAREICRERPR